MCCLPCAMSRRLIIFGNLKETAVGPMLLPKQGTVGPVFCFTIAGCSAFSTYLVPVKTAQTYGRLPSGVLCTKLPFTWGWDSWRMRVSVFLPIERTEWLFVPCGTRSLRVEIAGCFSYTWCEYVQLCCVYCMKRGHNIHHTISTLREDVRTIMPAKIIIRLFYVVSRRYYRMCE